MRAGGPTIQPMRRPGRPYAFDRPPVTSTRSERDPRASASLDRRARRHGRSRPDRIQLPYRSAMAARRSRSPDSKRAPVGLLGLQITISSCARRHQALEGVWCRFAIRVTRAASEGPMRGHSLRQPLERARQAPRLHEVRHHHHDLVAGFDEIPRRDVVGFRAAVGDLHVVGRRARVVRRDERRATPPCRSSVCMHRLGEQRVTRRGILHELAERQRLDAAFRQVEVHLVLVTWTAAAPIRMARASQRSLYSDFASAYGRPWLSCRGLY